MGTAIVLMTLLLPAGMGAGKTMESINHKLALAEMERLEQVEAPQKRLRMGEVYGYGQKPAKRTLRGR